MPEIGSEPEVPSEFERRMSLSGLGAGESRRALAADKRERAAIAARLKLVSVDSFDVSVRFQTVSKGKCVDAYGSLSATVRQSCVTTLQPVVKTYEEAFAIRFVGSQDASKSAVPTHGARAQDLTLDMDDRDIETLDGEEFDIGEVAIQYLALALDPYPRADGAPATDWSDSGQGGSEGDLERQNPFAVLKKLQDKT